MATLPAALLRQMVSHYLTTAHLTAELLSPSVATRKGLQSAPARPHPLPLGVPALAIQAARKAKRHARHP